MAPPPYELTATQVLDLLKNNTVTVEAYAQSLLDRVNENDSTIKAWAFLGKPESFPHLALASCGKFLLIISRSCLCA